MSSTMPRASRLAILTVTCALLTLAWGVAASLSATRVRIVTTMSSERAVADAQRFADLASVVAEELLGRRSSRDPLVVTLYETLAEYQAKDEELTGGDFATNWAFSSRATKESYLALMPPMPPPLQDEVGLTFLMQSQIAHEVGHQASYHVLPACAELPLWLSEGLACWVELETMRRAQRMTTIADPPFYSRRLVLVRSMLADRTWPGSAGIFTDDYGPLDGARRYAIWSVFCGWLFDDVLHEQRQALFAQARKIAATTPDARKKLTAIFTKALGKRAATLDAEFAKFVDTLKPSWDEPFRATEQRGEDWLTIAFDTSNATCMRVEPVGVPHYTVRGTIEFLPGATSDLRLHVARDAGHELEVHFVRDVGVIAHWNDFGGGGAPGPMGELSGAGPFAFEVRVEPERATVFIDGAEISSVPIETPANGGQVGIGAAAKSAGWWRDLEIEPKPRR